MKNHFLLVAAMGCGLAAGCGIAAGKPTSPVNFSGTDSERIEAAIAKACESGSRRVVIPRKPDGSAWLIDRAILLPGDFAVAIDDATIKLSDNCRDNFFRSANAGLGQSGDTPLKNIRILGHGRATLEGAARPRATGDGGKALTNPFPVVENPGWRNSFGTDAGRADETPKGDWRNIGVLFANIDGFVVRNLTIRDSHCWAMSFEACSHGVIRGITFDSCGTREIDGTRQIVRNQDGIDLRTGCHDIEISNIRGGTGDDVIALTAIAPAQHDPAKVRKGGEFGFTQVMHTDYTRRERDIYNVVISNVHASSWGGCAVVRLLPAECKIRHVTMTDIVETGSGERRSGHTLLLGDADRAYGRNLPGSMSDIKIDGVISSNAVHCVAVRGFLSDSSIENVRNLQASDPIIVTRKGGLKNVKLDFPRVWMSADIRDIQPEAKRTEVFKDLKKHGVEVIQVLRGPDPKVMARDYLEPMRRFGLRGYVEGGEITQELPTISGYGEEVVLAELIGGGYQGKAIERHLFTLPATKQTLVIAPPRYNAKSLVRGVEPVRAEVVVPTALFDGKQHLKIIPATFEPTDDGVAITFDLSDCADALLDKVGLAVYWRRPDSGKMYTPSYRYGIASVHAEGTRRAWEKRITSLHKFYCNANGGEFPSDLIIGLRLGDECFNVTGHLDGAATSLPAWDYSEPGIAAFRALAGAGVEYPRTWEQPEIYGEHAYGCWMYAFHKGCAELLARAVNKAHELMPGIICFRNTTRSDPMAVINNFDGTGQELLSKVLDIIHLDPYPVTPDGRMNDRITIDMAYLTGFARRFDKRLMPWCQAHTYPGLGHVTPEQVRQMVDAHRAFGIDGLMWLGYGFGNNGNVTFTFPKVRPDSWESAGDCHWSFRTSPLNPKPAAKIAVLRHYTKMATRISDRDTTSPDGRACAKIRELARAGIAFDVFEIPPIESAAAKSTRTVELTKYEQVLSF